MVQWVIWYEECVVKMACTPQQIKHTPKIGKLQILDLWTLVLKDSYYVKCGAWANLRAYKPKSI